MGWLEESKNYLNSTNEKNIENQILQSKEQIDKQNKEDYVNLFLSDEQIKEELKEQLGKETTDEQLQQYLEENYDSFIPEQYVVRGAKLFCSCGSHERKLNVFKDHAVYTEGFPMVHELDKELEKNITFFGVCSSGDPLLSSQSIKLVRITYDQEGNTIEDVVSGTMCVPFIIGGWRDTKENVKIIDNGDKDISDKYKYREDSGKGYKAVTTKSFLICRYGGIIEPLDSGQVMLEDNISNETSEEEFCKTMKDNFGFDENVGKILFKLANNVDSSYEFFTLVASINYNSIPWKIIADTKGKSNLKETLKKYGLNDDEIQLLINEVMNQHNACGWDTINEYYLGIFRENIDDPEYSIDEATRARRSEIFDMYNGKADFSHMCATLATILKENIDIVEFLGGIVAGQYNDINYILDDNAGYAGDIYGTFGAWPSMGKDDYKSDLDAINLANILKHNNYNNAADLLFNYYNNINNDKLNRADKFKDIQEIDKLLEEAKKSLEVETKNYNKSSTEAEKLISLYSKKVTLNFIYNIINNNSEFVEHIKISDEEKQAISKAGKKTMNYNK